MQIPIPEIFSAYNLYLRDGRPIDEVRTEYSLVTTGTGVASACISCGQCEAACPQQIGIIGLIAECADKLEV
jgi:predicted aldo/keto reductase-like oxidoreductase